MRGITIRLLVGISLIASLCFAEATFYDAYNRGMELEQAGKWSEAREHFLEAARMNPKPAKRVRTYGLNFLQNYDPYAHLARCEYQLGLYEEAYRHLEISRRAKVIPEDKLAQMKTRLEEAAKQRQKEKLPEPVRPQLQPAPEPLKPSPATLRLETNPPGAQVKVDGEDRGLTPIGVSLQAGEHQLQFDLEGYRQSRQTVQLKEGESQTVRIVLAESKSEPQQESIEATKKPVKAEEPLTEPAKQIAREVQPPVAEPDANRPAPSLQPGPEQPTQPAPAVERKQNRALILIIGILIATLVFVVYRNRRPAQTLTTPVAAPTLQQTVKAEETPTQDLRLGSTPRTPTPLDRVAVEEIRKHARELPPGARKEIGAYHLIGMLGRGGMGTTYLARRKRDGLAVAIKVPHEHLLDNHEFTQRFLREGSLGTTLHHPSIIRILEAGQSESMPFIVMELLQGRTLENRLREEGRLRVREALEIAREIAVALDYARLKGIVHRDLKPENILMLERGGLKVMDFGIARVEGSPGLTSSEAYLGTPSYSSPEATGGGEVDQQSDLYSLGIILYRLLTGQLPFRSMNPLEVLDLHRRQPLPAFPADLKIPGDIFALVKRLTEKDKAERYPNAESFLIELNQVLNHLRD